MAQKMYHESGQDGRSVLGMLAVQVEKDPKTGATIVRSVAPMSTPADTHMAPTIFDDGRRSIHAVGGTAAQPSSEELGQILSVIDGVGMKALLDEVTITPVQEEAIVEDVAIERAPEGNLLSINQAMSNENSLKSQEEVCTGSVAKRIDSTEVSKKTVATDSLPKVEVTEGEMLCEGPVTLVFMGYTDSRSEGEALGPEEHEGMLTAERVIITDDGEELLLGQDSAVPPQEPLEDIPEQEKAKESQDKQVFQDLPLVQEKAKESQDKQVFQDIPLVQEKAKESQDKQVFQDIPLEGKSEQVPEQGEEGKREPHLSIEEGQGKPKRKTCQCCTIM